MVEFNWLHELNMLFYHINMIKEAMYNDYNCPSYNTQPTN